MQIPEQVSRLRMKPYYGESQMSKLDMNVKVRIGLTLGVLFEYNSEIFRKDTIERFAMYFREIMSDVIKDSKVKLKDIKISHDLKAVHFNIKEIDLEF